MNKKIKNKNLIVLLGNGFDLAHGLETSYNNFANYYLKNVIIKNLLEEGGKDILGYNYYSKYYNKSMYTSVPNPKNLEDKLETLFYLIKNKEEEEIKDYITKYPESLIILKNTFLSKLFLDSYDNWFDIEQAYYEELITIFKSLTSIKSNIKEAVNEKIKTLNTELKSIKIELKKYLKNEVKPSWNKNVSYCLEQHFKERTNVVVINFNYTDTIQQYLNTDLNVDNIKNHHIHNNLNSDIIFGYGDDTDEVYRGLKNTKNNEFLRCFKTFDYLKSKNYRLVLNELITYKEGYDVLIIGHSLGMTDKTILKTILDNDSCQNIELLKRSDLNSLEEKQEHLFELYANLARIFDSEASLREKVIPFEWTVNFPLMYDTDESTIYSREKGLYEKPNSLKFIK